MGAGLKWFNIFLLFGLLWGMACGPSKIKTPADVERYIKVGMTNPEVIELLDTDGLTAAGAFITVHLSSLKIVGNKRLYTPTKDIDSPYYMWLIFGQIVNNIDPALIVFNAKSNIVIEVGRMPFEEARAQVEKQSGRTFRR